MFVQIAEAFLWGTPFSWVKRELRFTNDLTSLMVGLESSEVYFISDKARRDMHIELQGKKQDVQEASVTMSEGTLIVAGSNIEVGITIPYALVPSISLNTLSGKIRIENALCKTCLIQSGYSDIEINNSLIDKLDLTNDSGSTKIFDIAGEAHYIKADAATVSVLDSKGEELTIDSRSSRVITKGNSYAKHGNMNPCMA